MPKDPQAGLERLASRHDERERRRLAALRPPTLTPAQEEAEAARLRRRALAEAGLGARAIATANFTFFVLILGGGIGLAVMAPFSESLFWPVFMAGNVAAWIAAFVVAPMLTEALVSGPLASRQLSRLRRLPFTWDLDAYLADLSRQRKWVTLRIDCALRPPCDPSTRTLFTRAAHGLVHKVKVSIRDAPDGTISLKLTQLDLEGYVTVWGRYGRTGSYFSNAALHETFCRVAFELLPQVSALCPIEHVTVTVEGDLVPLALGPDDVRS